eukprot:2062672-Alexandrium_andersonii.AAC.1
MHLRHTLNALGQAHNSALSQLQADSSCIEQSLALPYRGRATAPRDPPKNAPPGASAGGAC